MAEATFGSDPSRTRRTARADRTLAACSAVRALTGSIDFLVLGLDHFWRSRRIVTGHSLAAGEAKSRGNFKSSHYPNLTIRRSNLTICLSNLGIRLSNLGIQLSNLGIRLDLDFCLPGRARSAKVCAWTPLDSPCDSIERNQAASR
jgi:hypothetical protein